MQNLCIISKKNLAIEFFLHGNKHSSLFLIEEARHAPNTQNRKLVMFLQYPKEKDIDEAQIKIKNIDCIQINMNIWSRLVKVLIIFLFGLASYSKK